MTSKMATSAAEEEELRIPTPDDFEGIGLLQATAFAEKICCCESAKDLEKATTKAYKKYEENHPQKLEHCRVIKNKDGVVMAACQLQLQGDVADLSFPSPMRHELLPGEVYLEWIACHPDHTGKGLGSKLLKWAESFAREQAKAEFLSLGVMQANDGAVRLYERKGFVVKPDPHLTSQLETCMNSCMIFCCLGCKYWNLLYMEMPLTDSATEEQPVVKESMDR